MSQGTVKVISVNRKAGGFLTLCDVFGGFKTHKNMKCHHVVFKISEEKHKTLHFGV